MIMRRRCFYLANMLASYLLFPSLAFAEETGDTSTSTVPTTTPIVPTGSIAGQTSATSPVQVIDANTASLKVAKVLNELYQAIGVLIGPLGFVMLSITAIIFIVGAVLGIKFLRNVGFCGLLGCIFGIVLYVAIPVVVGTAVGVGKGLN